MAAIAAIFWIGSLDDSKLQEVRELVDGAIAKGHAFFQDIIEGLKEEYAKAD